MSEAYLILENGSVFKGKSFGYDGEAIGELVFSTSMTGYMEALSDPAYHGQILLQTFPLIGNYGAIHEDFGPGTAHLKAYIVRDWCQEPSNFRSEGNLDSFLREKKIPGLFGIDTRKLTREIREHGVMNAKVSKKSELSKDEWATLRNTKITDAIKAVSVADGKWEIENGKSGKHVAVWDFGGAHKAVKWLEAHGCHATVMPFDATADQLLEKKPDGIVLSGGPGDPAENVQIIEQIKKLCGKNVPMLGLDLGHQMLALANGAKTEKLHFGHRGANQAVKEVCSTRAFVTTQNHGYAVNVGSLPENAIMSFVNVNDGTCEGIEYKNIPAFSIQFAPDEEIFNKFKTIMEGGCPNASE
ncbi:MAG: carbamoyl phosphate synthase small subunit [Oscillospiraceae bacterium]|nr:carbamoyl phosphate synthase small subunit [Oscillospiraceae bacterium]